MFIQIIDQLLVAFDNLQIALTQIEILARGIDSTRFKSAQLVVRVDAKTGAWAGGANAPTIAVNLVSTWPNPQAPQTAFHGLTLATATVGVTTLAGDLLQTDTNRPLGPAVDVSLVATQAGGAATTFGGTLSVGILFYED